MFTQGQLKEEESKDQLNYGDLSSQFESHRSDFNRSLGSVVGISKFTANDPLPYMEAIRCIEKIPHLQSPREKLQCISESFASLKTAVVEYWKGKVELNTMDDVLPLTIYCVSVAQIDHPASEFNIMEDYLSIYDRGFEFEKKLLTNFDVSIKYINSEWEIEKMPQSSPKEQV